MGSDINKLEIIQVSSCFSSVICFSGDLLTRWLPFNWAPMPYKKDRSDLRREIRKTKKRMVPRLQRWNEHGLVALPPPVSAGPSAADIQAGEHPLDSQLLNEIRLLPEGKTSRALLLFYTKKAIPHCDLQVTVRLDPDACPLYILHCPQTWFFLPNSQK